MSFLYPIFIYLMLPVTLILFYFIMTGSKESFLMFDKAVLEKLRLENRSLGRNARNTLFLSSFIFMILALAQPVFKEGELVVEAKSADILIGIDISDSMKAEDRFPNRLDFAKAKAIELIKQAPHNRIGVLAFARHDYIVSPLSFDHGSVAFLLSKIQTGSITEKGTHLDSMLHSAISMLEHAKEKNLLLFTDGGDKKEFSEEIALAKENGLRLFIVGVGTGKGSPVRSPEGGFVKHEGNILISRLNSGIKELATQTGGVYIESVLGDDDIQAMLKEIESITEKSTMKEETIPQYTQLFYYPLALALFFLLLAFSSMPKSVAKAFLLLGLLFAGREEARAGLLDFQKLKDAKEAYAQEEYQKSTGIYEEFAIRSPEAIYNLANSLYKEKEYERALKVYDEVKTPDPELKARALHNRANAHVQLKQYEEALKSYEEALRLKEDTQTKENYEAVKKFLQEQKEQEKKENEKRKQEAEDKKSSDKNEQSKEHDGKEKDGKKDQDKQKSDPKGSQESQQQEKSQEEKSEESNEKREKLEKKGEIEQSETSSEKSQAEKEKEAAEAEQKYADKLPVNMKKMSELEAKKWLKVIQQSQKGHLYRMDDLEHKEDEDEKPW